MKDALVRPLGLIHLDAVLAEDSTAVLPLDRVVHYLQTNLAVKKVPHVYESLVGDLVGRDQATLKNLLLLLRH